MRIWAAPLLMLAVLVAGCVPPQEYDQGNQKMAAGDPAEAVRLYQQALARTDDKDQRAQINKALAEARAVVVERRLAQAQAALDAGGGEIPSLAKALEAVQGAPIDDSRLTAKADGLKARLEAARGRLAELKTRATAEAQAGRPARAAELLGQALTLEPGDAELAAKRQRLVGDVVERLNQALAAGDWPAAQGLLADLERIDPDNPRLASAKVQFAQQGPAATKAQLEALTAAEQWQRAYAEIMASPFRDELAAQLAEVRAQGGRFYLQRADHMLVDGAEPFGPYLDALRATLLDPHNQAAQEALAQAGDLVAERLTRTVALGPFASPEARPQAGEALRARLAEALRAVLPWPVGVLATSDAERALAAAKPAQLGEVAAELGADLVISGQVAELVTDERRHASQGQARVELGEAIKANPAWLEMAERHGPDPAKWPARPEPVIRTPKVEMATYRRGEAAFFAQLTVTVHQYDVMANKALPDTVLAQDARFSDEWQEPVLGVEPPVPGDPLELPTPEEAAAGLEKELARRIAGLAVERYQGRLAGLLDEAEADLAAGRAQLAQANIAQAHLLAARTGRLNGEAARRLARLVAAAPD